jgi:hypothetical protein
MQTVADMLNHDRVSDLHKQIESFLAFSWERHRLNYWLGAFATLAAIILGLAITVAGVLNHSLIAAILGAVVSALLSIQNAFKFIEKSNHWERKHNDAKALRDRLTYKVKEEREFQELVDSWLHLKADLVEKMPQVSSISSRNE